MSVPVCSFVVVAIVQLPSHVQLFVTPWTAAHQASLSFTISWSWLKFMSIESWCYLTTSSSAALFSFAFNLFQNQGLFQWLALHIRWPKYWDFSFTISPSSEYTGLISFGIDCLISLLSMGLSRAFSNTIVERHQFFSAQLSLSPTLTSIHEYWKNHSFD